MAPTALGTSSHAPFHFVLLPRTLGWALLAVQFFAGYAALTAFVHVAKKED